MIRTLAVVSCDVTRLVPFSGCSGTAEGCKERLCSLQKKLHWGGDGNIGIFIAGGFTVCCCFSFLKAKGSCLRNE